MMKRSLVKVSLAAGLVMHAWSAAGVGFPALPVRRCEPDAVVAGTVCLDRYEASVWRVPNPTTTNATLVRRIQLGAATRADLMAGGATQLGTAMDDYAPCPDNGQNCADDIYAGWASFSNDDMCLAGASTIRNSPGALVRGGAFAAVGGPLAGPFAVHPFPPFRPRTFIGFRCAR